MKYMMEDEIKSQGMIIESLIRRYIVNYCVLADIPIDIKRIVLIASGSSYNASLYGKYFFEQIASVPTSVEYASEVANSKFVNFEKDTTYIFISQSGNSVDTVSAMKKVKDAGAFTICITNNTESIMYNMAHYHFDIFAGREQAIAATKTFSASVLMLWLLAIKTAQNKHIDVSEETKNIYSIRQSIDNCFDNIENIDQAVKYISKLKEFSIVGFNYHYPLARETALKIKETSYINTGSYPMGEFIHGHFALLNKSKVFLAFITDDCSCYELETLKKIQTTYKTKSIVISDSFNDYSCDILVKFPHAQSKIANIINMIITVQVLAFKVARRLKRNIDKPKGLNKVVTKEENK